MATVTLDMRGMSCPIPILRANKTAKESIHGDRIEIFVTDTGAPEDFEVFCDTTGHELIECSKGDDGVFTIIIGVRDKSVGH